jgi:hypothetical protein
MISSLFRPKTRGTRGDRRPLLLDRHQGSPASQHLDSSAESDLDDEDGSAHQCAVGEDEEHHPLLPIFSAAHLGALSLLHRRQRDGKLMDACRSDTRLSSPA